jgi:DNA invertase Pin-like site-specific DNA recombinase
MTKRVGLYLRVSTKNGQTVDNQRQALTEAIGRRPGWVITDEFPDEGISGAKSRETSPRERRLRGEAGRAQRVPYPLGISVTLIWPSIFGCSLQQ